MQGGFFLRKKPLGSSGFGVQQLENRYCVLSQEFMAKLGLSSKVGLSF
jgi:hypothetical protein